MRCTVATLRGWRLVPPLAAVAILGVTVGCASTPDAGSSHARQPSVDRSSAATPTPDARRPAPPWAADLLHAQWSAVATGDEQHWLSSWSASAVDQQRARAIWTNLRKLREARVSGQPAPGARLPTGPDDGQLPVALTWRSGEPGAAPAHSTVCYRFRLEAGRPVVTGMGAANGFPVPVWLLPSVHVRRTPRTLAVAASAATARRLSGLLQTAIGDVNRVLPHWKGSLVAYLPADRSGFDHLLAAQRGEYSGIAAVTATVDGSDRPAAPEAIVVNPRVFAGLGPTGAHVVVTHEATHMATGVAARPMPPWVAEGFADYVAIGSVRVSLSKSAARVIREVRADGPPGHLPGVTAFASPPGRLEAIYEQAFLANRLIARTFGQQRLVAFYRAVRARPDRLSADFRSVLHTTIPQFTNEWRHALLALATR